MKGKNKAANMRLDHRLAIDAVRPIRSFSYVRWAARVSVKNIGEKAVLMVLAEAVDNATGKTYLGQQRIAQRCSLSREAVCRIMRRLEGLQLIKRQSRKDRKGKRTSDWVTIIPCALPSYEMAEICDFESEKNVIAQHRIPESIPKRKWQELSLNDEYLEERDLARTHLSGVIGEDFLRSYFDPATWLDEKNIVAKTAIAYEKLSALSALSALGLKVHPPGTKALD